MKRSTFYTGQSFCLLFFDEEAAVYKRLLMRTALVMALIAGAGALSGAASAQRPDDRFQQRQGDRIPTYNSDTQQLGYEHGYRDGADRGRQDRDRRLARNTGRDNDYLDSARY